LKEKEFKKALEIAREYWDVEINKFDDKNLPESWDWRNVEGYDFTSKMRDQAACGSCYAVSFI